MQYYGAESLAKHGDTLYVLNGADVGNFIEKFNTSGAFVKKIDAKYNYPADMVIGDNGLVLVSADEVFRGKDKRYEPGLIIRANWCVDSIGLTLNSRGLSVLPVCPNQILFWWPIGRKIEPL